MCKNHAKNFSHTRIHFVECGVCHTVAVCTVVKILNLKYIQVATLTLSIKWHHRSGYNSLYLISYGCFIGTDTNLKSVASTILEWLAIDMQKFTGHVTLASGHTSCFGNFLRGHVGTVSGTCIPNLKSVALAILELLPFNTQTFTGSCDPNTPFRVILGLSSTIAKCALWWKS